MQLTILSILKQRGCLGKYRLIALLLTFLLRQMIKARNSFCCARPFLSLRFQRQAHRVSFSITLTLHTEENAKPCALHIKFEFTHPCGNLHLGVGAPLTSFLCFSLLTVLSRRFPARQFTRGFGPRTDSVVASGVYFGGRNDLRYTVASEGIVL